MTVSRIGRSTVNTTISYTFDGCCSPRSRKYFSRLFLTTSWILSLLMMLLLDSRCGTSPLLLIHPSCLRKQTAIAAVRGIRPPFFLRQGDIVTVRHVPAVFQKKHQLQHVAHRNPRYGSCLVETPHHRSDP